MGQFQNDTTAAILASSDREDIANTSLSGAHLEVELYTVVWTGAILAAVALPGFLVNLAILLATRCSHTVRKWQFGLVYNLAAANLLLCAVWLPLHLAHLRLNYAGIGLNPFLCYLHVTLFNLCACVVVCTVVFIAIQHGASFSGDIDKGLGAMVGIGIALSWISGCACAIYVGLGYSGTGMYSMCEVGHLTLGVPRELSHSNCVIVVVFLVALLLSAVVLLSLIAHRRVTMYTDPLTCHKIKHCSYPVTQDYTEDEKMMINSQMTPTSSSQKDLSDFKKSSENMDRRGRRESRDAQDAEAEDEDTFDLQMMSKMQKSSRGSGRRHTVANIGLGDAPVGARRGSLGEFRGPKQATNYQYVRKFSVDIVALQDQLENPKSFGGSANFSFTALGPPPTTSLSRNSSSEVRPSTPIPATLEEEEDAELEEAEESPPDNNATKPTEAERETLMEPKVTKDVISDAEVPAITIQSTEPEVKESGNASKKDVCLTFKPKLAKIKSSHEQIIKLWKVALVVLISVLCLSPLIVTCFFSATNLSQSWINVVYITLTLPVIQCPVHAGIMIWAEPLIARALRRLKMRLTNWRCVCYCHVGQRHQCFWHQCGQE